MGPSDHDRLEGRGEGVRYLVRMIDDATSRSPLKRCPGALPLHHKYL